MAICKVAKGEGSTGKKEVEKLATEIRKTVSNERYIYFEAVDAWAIEAREKMDEDLADKLQTSLSQYFGIE